MHLSDHRPTCHVLQPRNFAAEVQVKVVQIGEHADHEGALTGKQVTAVQLQGSQPREACKHQTHNCTKRVMLHVLQYLPVRSPIAKKSWDDEHLQWQRSGCDMQAQTCTPPSRLC